MYVRVALMRFSTKVVTRQDFSPGLWLVELRIFTDCNGFQTKSYERIVLIT